MYLSQHNRGPQARHNLSNPVYQNAHIAALRSATASSITPDTPKISTIQGIHFSKTNDKAQNRNDSVQYVHPDIPQTQTTNLRMLGSMNKLQTGQVLRSSEYGIYDDADGDIPERQDKKNTQDTTTQQEENNSNNWFSNKTLKSLLCSAILIIIFLGGILVGVIILPKLNNSTSYTTTTTSTSTSISTSTEHTTTSKGLFHFMY